jgi:hypothetical protein
MPRKAAASLAIKPKAVIANHISPPSSLSPAEATLWREVVETKPAGWFDRDSAPVLKEYVRAVVTCDDLAALVRRALAGGDDDIIRRMLGLRDVEAKRVASLATKLRLTQQSRYTPQAASTANAKVSGKRPWQL